MQNPRLVSTNPPNVARARVPVLSAFFMIYIFVSGGSFGIEEMVSSSGPGLTLLLLLLLPIFWALPMALIASELGSALPSSGGFYIWTRRALGDFWGFQTAWWWSMALLVDTSLYIILSVSYLQNQLGFGEITFYLICWSIIFIFTVINIVGIRLIAFSSAFFSILIISPFLVLAVVGLANWEFNPFIPITPPGSELLGTDGTLVLGLSIGLWMYSGYESISTLAGEIEQPQRVIPRALMLTLPFVTLMYVLPTLGSIASFGHWELFSVDTDGAKVSFVDIGRTVGGTALGHALLVSAVIGNLALYLDYMASGARPLHALAADGLFPRSVSYVSRRFGTPIAAIILVAIINSILIIGPFQSLVVIDVTLMVCSYTVIFIAAVRLRVREPELSRPFRIPLGTIGLILLIMPPLALVVLMLYVTTADQTLSLFGTQGIIVNGFNIGWYGIVSGVALLSGPVFYPVLKKRYGGPASPDDRAGLN